MYGTHKVLTVNERVTRKNVAMLFTVYVAEARRKIWPKYDMQVIMVEILNVILVANDIFCKIILCHLDS